VLGADAKGCSLASGQGRYSHNVWNRQEALRLQRQVAAAEKAAERERKLQETAAGKARAERLTRQERIREQTSRYEAALLAIRMTSHVTRAALHKSLLAWGSGIGKVFSTIWN